MTDMPEFDLESFTPYRLAIAAQRASEELARQYRTRFGISIAEWRVLAHLALAVDVSVRDIQTRVGMEKSKVSRAASRLEANGYLSKTANPDDGRLVSLALTAKGRRMMKELAPVAKAYEAELMDMLGQEGPAFRDGIAKLLRD